MWYPVPVNFRRKPLNFAVVAEILLCLYKQFVSYVRAKTEKISDFCAHMVDFRRPGHIYYVHTLVYIYCDFCLIGSASLVCKSN